MTEQDKERADFCYQQGTRWYTIIRQLDKTLETMENTFLDCNSIYDQIQTARNQAHNKASIYWAEYKKLTK